MSRFWAGLLHACSVGHFLGRSSCLYLSHEHRPNFRLATRYAHPGLAPASTKGRSFLRKATPARGIVIDTKGAKFYIEHGAGENHILILTLTLTLHALLMDALIDERLRRQTPTQRGW
ncbi:hypothetical protein N431DRAFT_157987 [Stipitochalara longipes BDJ]|nr:hypothetical protein N431DRAFT_157987 [Stipitochalara longipes BDJ]